MDQCPDDTLRHHRLHYQACYPPSISPDFRSAPKGQHEPLDYHTDPHLEQRSLLHYRYYLLDCHLHSAREDLEFPDNRRPLLFYYRGDYGKWCIQRRFRCRNLDSAYDTHL